MKTPQHETAFIFNTEARGFCRDLNKTKGLCAVCQCFLPHSERNSTRKNDNEDNRNKKMSQR